MGFPYNWPQSSQYPPMNFGPTFGLNAGGCYYYLNYYSPTAYYLYWAEMMRVGHRDLPTFLMPDVGTSDMRHYVRNQYHMLSAAGLTGMSYFYSPWMKPDAEKEHLALAPLRERFSPVQYRLKPAPKRAALLVPFSQMIHQIPYAFHNGVASYMNLIMAHLDVEMIAEEEVDVTACPVILIAGAEHLREATLQSLERFLGRGGKVILDSKCKLPLSGAIKLDISLDLDREYGKKENIAAVRKALEPYNLVAWDAPAETTLLRPFVSRDGVRYLYVVDTDDGEEYATVRAHLFNRERETPEQRARAEEFMRTHGMSTPGGPDFPQALSLTVTFPSYELPRGGQVMDIFSDKALPTEPAGEGRLAVKVPLQSFGGTILAFMPAPVAKLRIAGETELARGKGGVFHASLLDAGGRTQPGVYPLQVALKDPSGAVNRELTGDYAADEGMLALTFTPARNHPTGPWTLEITELTSGVRGVLTFRVQ